MAIITSNPNPIKWTPHGVQLELTTKIDSINIIRTSETEFKISKINVSWKGTWSGTWAGMKVQSGDKEIKGNVEIGIPYYEDKTGSVQSGSGTLENCKYIISGGNGAQNKTIIVTYINYNPYSGEYAENAVALTVPVPKYVGPVSNAALTIRDNYNNTFNVEGQCDGGQNNEVFQSIAWGYTSNYELDSANTTLTTSTSGKKISKTNIPLNISDDTAATREIYARYSVSGYTDKSGPYTVEKDFGIKQYVKPSNPGKPTLTEDSYKNGRLTIKKPWTFSWEAAREANSSSPVKGYLVRLLRQAKGTTKLEKIDITNKDGKIISNTHYLYDQCINTTDTSITIYPDANGFEPNDKVQIKVLAYSLSGKDNDGNIMVANNVSLASAYAISDVLQVQNAGVVRIKTANGWVEGQVYVKTNSGWKEATSVHVKTNNGWKESI